MKDTILAGVQSHWSDEIYLVWHEHDKAARRGMQAIR
jgi:hypothetical protein